MKRCVITVKGIVQGVGFRPFVYNLASRLALKGTIKNTLEGLVIDVEGDEPDRLLSEIRQSPPPLAKIDELHVEYLEPSGISGLQIVSSEGSGSFTLLSPDVSVCEDCLKELLDPLDRRYGYPFINCTNCGPRYSITFRIPYDRQNTTMSVFEMCPDCHREYHDPSNRRFHAQPNACPSCGPKVFVVILEGSKEIKDDPIGETIKILKAGGIVAVKGLGGFHLCCNAEDETAVALLRSRKRKSNKPFAMMLPTVEHVASICEMSDTERWLLTSNKRPIVLMKRLSDSLSKIKIARSVSPNNRYFGCMLPYTPLHYLLFYHNQREPHFNALVMTSGNLAEEPIVKDNDMAVQKLSPFVDALLLHNRNIFVAIDDSVVRVVETDLVVETSEPTNQKRTAFTSFIRRARGYVPEAIVIGNKGDDVLGVGADIKNAFAIAKGRYGIMSQHIGDMENEETLRFYEGVLDSLSKVYGFNATAVGYDMHPDYLSTRWAIQYCQRRGIKGFALQHHHCHIASVIAEEGIEGRVVGVAFDGAGYGTDGNIWGSEFMVCEGAGFHRVASFEYLPLPGGDRAVKECWRVAMGFLRSNLTEQDYWSALGMLGFVERYGQARIENLTKLIDANGMSPLSSGAGRYFDAVSAILGLCDQNTFEGEAAMALESVVDEYALSSSGHYHYSVIEKPDNDKPQYTVVFKEMAYEILQDIMSKEPISSIATRFHNTIKSVIVELVMGLAEQYNTNKVVLSGGVFQNLCLLRSTIEGLSSKGMRVYCNKKVPANDGGIALGQVYIVRELLKKGVEDDKVDR